MTPATARSDDLADHVSYADVVARLKERATSTRHVQLVETLAEEAADFALADARVESVVVDVRKTEIVPEARGVGVIIHRQRGAQVSPMRPDVSVIMPAYQATATIVRAVQSVFAQKGVAVELVLCADDELDYGGAAAGRAARRRTSSTLCRTPAPRSGPSAARNIATRQARADIIACLDADDAYAPDRLARLLPLVERYGVATGPTREIDPRTRAVAYGPAAAGRRVPADRGHLRAAHAVLARLSEGANARQGGRRSISPRT